MNDKQIRIACKGSRMAELEELEVIQGDLKDLTEVNYLKLRKRIETKGFDAPLFVWGNKILDGTQRYRVVQTMLQQGWKLRGGKVPVCDIEAESLDEAKSRLLGYISQYGKVTGLEEFLAGMKEADMETVQLPGLDINRPQSTIDGPASEGDDDWLAEDFGPTRVVVMCPGCGHEFALDDEDE